MGRIKSVAIKNLAMDLMEKDASKFSEDFEKNKKAVDGMRHIESKKIRNVVAGYITSEMQRVKKSGL